MSWLRDSLFILSIVIGISLSSVWTPARGADKWESTFKPTGANRDEFGYSLGVGAFYSDNIGRQSSNTESDGASDVSLQLHYTRERKRFDAQIASDLEYRKYFRDTYGTDLVGGLNGNLGYWLLPERLQWSVQENFGQTYTDLRGVQTPNNRQNVNYLSTGPDLTLPFASRSELRAQARWSKATFGGNDIDSNHRLSGTLGLLRNLTEHSAISLNVADEKVQYDHLPSYDDYDRRSAYMQFDGTGARTELSGQLGWSKVNAPAVDSGGLLAEVRLLRKLGARSELTLNAGTGFTDSAEAFRREQNIGGIVVGNERVAVDTSPFRQDYATAAWDLIGVRDSITLTANWRREVHRGDQELNRKEKSGDLLLSRRLTPVLTVLLNGHYLHDDFSTASVNFNEWSIGPGLSWSLARNIRVTFRYDHFQGSGDSSTLIGVHNYKENRIEIRFSYGSFT
jgi:hypothetical protein